MFVLHKHSVRAIIGALKESIAYQKQNGVLLRATEAQLAISSNIHNICGVPWLPAARVKLFVHLRTWL
jgi:hypothetical protein